MSFAAAVATRECWVKLTISIRLFQFRYYDALSACSWFWDPWTILNQWYIHLAPNTGYKGIVNLPHIIILSALHRIRKTMLAEKTIMLFIFSICVSYTICTLVFWKHTVWLYKKWYYEFVVLQICLTTGCGISVPGEYYHLHNVRVT